MGKFTKKQKEKGIQAITSIIGPVIKSTFINPAGTEDNFELDPTISKCDDCRWKGRDKCRKCKHRYKVIGINHGINLFPITPSPYLITQGPINQIQQSLKKR